MTVTMEKREMMEMELDELGRAAGGDSFDDFVAYMNYMDMLYEKYNCLGKGPRYLESVCTPAERAKIKRLYRIAVYGESPDKAG